MNLIEPVGWFECNKCWLRACVCLRHFSQWNFILCPKVSFWSLTSFFIEKWSRSMITQYNWVSAYLSPLKELEHYYGCIHHSLHLHFFSFINFIFSAIFYEYIVDTNPSFFCFQEKRYACHQYCGKKLQVIIKSPLIWQKFMILSVRSGFHQWLITIWLLNWFWCKNFSV